MGDRKGVDDATARRWQLTTASILSECASPRSCPRACWTAVVMTKFTLRAGSQNGSILEAIKTWRRNVDKHFAGCGLCAVALPGWISLSSAPRAAWRSAPFAMQQFTASRASCPACRARSASTSSTR
jgi:hypothetical protein